MSSKKDKFADYYLGLDIGTNSVGWCVTDPEYKILKFNGKAMWGIRLFDEAESASERRVNRSSRRRIKREKQRVKLLEEMLNPEVSKVDPLFYLRLKESKFWLEDKKEAVRQKYALFADRNYTDVDYYNEFPTIYHLRYALMKHAKKYDIRLYYLAISHMMKHRGHFLFSGSVEEATSFDTVFSALEEYVAEHFNFTLIADDKEKLKNLLKDRKLGKSDRKKELQRLYPKLTDKKTDNMRKEAMAALAGSKVSLEKLYADPELKDAEVDKISFSDGIDDKNEEQLENELAERFEYITKLKSLYDWAVLTNILSDSRSISEAQVKSYEKHKKDLADLKYAVRKYIPDSYKEIFSADDVKENYASYVRHSSRKNGVVAKGRKTEQKDFCDYIKNKFKSVEIDDPVLDRIKRETENYTFMPKQRTKSNSAVPHQVNEMDLKKILDNMALDYPELGEKQSDGLSVCEKIEKMFSFRIPYFVGPLNGYHSDKGGNSWVVRKETGPVRPWNFDQKVDAKASAEAFITRLTNKCTYLIGEDVLPKDSLLYSRYLVLNELNNVRIDGERLTVDIKHRIYNEIFKVRTGKYSLKKLRKWLLKEGVIDEEAVLSGIDEVFQSSLKSYQDFYRIIETKVNTDPLMVEDIIKNIVIFGEDKHLLRERIAERYSDRLSEDEIRRISKLTYTGWGRFSRKLLNGITDTDHETGENLTIIQSMWNGQENFMELMSSRHGFMEKVRDHNERISGKSRKISYELVQDSYASPAVKRGIWQTLLIVKEIQKVTGHNPERVFVEMARSREADPKRSVSRKQQLLKVYKKSRDEEAKEFASEIESTEERKFQSKKLYLYYTQMGIDMYSGKHIDLGELFTDVYNIDHIYPQSKTKDDSILNNMVLVKADENRDKGDDYPIPAKFRQPKLWKMLHDKGLITKEKYDRLMRRNELTDEELASFIGRQLVETRQTAKVVTQILEQTMPETRIVYSKANAVSRFRQKNGFVKSRSVNDYHHAKDAYLNIVVGNVYFTKFTDNPVNYIKNMRKSNDEKYSLNKMFEYDVERNGRTAWKRGREGTIATVNKYMNKNNILFTRYAVEKHGGFYDQNPVRKDSGNLLPIKTTDDRYDIHKYGGYNKPSINYYMLVESKDKKGRNKRTIEGVPVYLSGAPEEKIKEFCVSELKLKDPDIRIPKIKINALLKLDGYPMHISGKTGNSVLIKSALQLCLSKEQNKIVHNIDRVIEKIRNDKNYKIDEYDHVSNEDMMALYDCLQNKASNTIYSVKLASPLNVIVKGREHFSHLSIADKCKLLNEMLHLFQCNSLTSNLTLIDGKARSGVLTINKDITKYCSAKLINQSVTGLFEQETDLLTV